MGANLRGLSLGIVGDAIAIPELAISYLQRKLGDAIANMNIQFNMDELLLGERPKDQNGKIVLIPGYAASPRHLDKLADHLGDNVITNPHFEKRKLTERVLEDAKTLALSIIREGHQINICAHSRGGLVTLCAMKMLEELQKDELIRKVFLLSPTSHGIRAEITPIAQQLGIGAIEDLCPGSEAVNYWQGLSIKNRSKIHIISQEGGDGFTSPDHSFVDGSTMFVTPHCGHQKSIRDPSTDFFRLTIELIHHSVVGAN
ncbi:hypothetical protein KBC97_00455 [Candidatus Gracilibacteria bacterium]|nr:hypothetical protein [Candidatus Gracilibacteria bacterium]